MNEKHNLDTVNQAQWVVVVDLTLIFVFNKKYMRKLRDNGDVKTK